MITRHTKDGPKIGLRKYQLPVFEDFDSKVLVVDWSRQIGKSFTMANWAVKRLLMQLQTHENWLIVVLSNSKDNGSEFAMKVSEVCRAMGQVIESEFPADLDTVKFEDMRFEIKLKVGSKLGRIKILAASPRTARGFSGDLILDEFAFHEDDRAIWAAAEPIISANPEYLCRICSTRNGTRTLFHLFATSGQFPVNQVKRSDAWKMGEIKIVSLKQKGPDGKPKALTPEEAEKEAVDRKEYRQNYECESADELGSVLTWEQIQEAERLAPFAFDEQSWSVDSLQRISAAKFGGAEIVSGVDIARVGDFTACSVLAVGHDGVRTLVALLKMRDCRLPYQQHQLDRIMHLVERIGLDCTGIGLGLYEYLQDAHGGKVHGINFSTTVPVESSDALLSTGRRGVTAKITEVMALDLSTTMSDGKLAIPYDPWLREDLHKPERVVSASGRVSVAATRDVKTGHADGFWSLALAERMARFRSGDSWTEEQADAVVMGGNSFSDLEHITRFSRTTHENARFKALSALWGVLTRPEGLRRKIGQLTARLTAIFSGSACRLVGNGRILAIALLFSLGAPHIRQRIWILADSRGFPEYSPLLTEDCPQLGRTSPVRCKNWKQFALVPGVPAGRGKWRALGQPGLVRVNDGVADVLDRLHAVGNGQVPAVAAMAWRHLQGGAQT